jgi:non-ribosomal peptide synthetase component E (peptide arylation enzyme)
MDLARNLIGRINVGDSLTRSAATRPGQLAVVDGNRRLTYQGFNAYVNRIAHGQAGLGYERGAAFVVPKPGETIDAAELIAAVKTRLDGFKAPKDVVFVDRLPKTSTGKIQKNVVRSEHARRYQEG